MSPTPPEADIEYSRGSRFLRDLSRRSAGRRRKTDPARRAGATRSVLGAILIGGGLGALLLLVAEFTTLFDVTASTGTVPIRSVATGSHHSYALVPIALLAAVFAFSVWRVGSRPALLAIGLLGLLALLIAVLGDLPDARATGLVLRGSHYVAAGSSPSAGLYMETLGAVVLIATCACGFLLIGPPPGSPSRHGPRRSSPAA